MSVTSRGEPRHHLTPLFAPGARALVCSEGNGLTSLSLGGGVRISSARPRGNVDKDGATSKPPQPTALISAGGKHVLTGGSDGMLRMWNLNRIGGLREDGVLPIHSSGGAPAPQPPILKLAAPSGSAWRGHCYALVGQPRSTPGSNEKTATRCKLVSFSLSKKCVSLVIDHKFDVPSHLALPAGALAVAERSCPPPPDASRNGHPAGMHVVMALATCDSLRLYLLQSCGTRHGAGGHAGTRKRRRGSSVGDEGAARGRPSETEAAAASGGSGGSGGSSGAVRRTERRLILPLGHESDARGRRGAGAGSGGYISALALASAADGVSGSEASSAVVTGHVDGHITVWHRLLDASAPHWRNASLVGTGAPDFGGVDGGSSGSSAAEKENVRALLSSVVKTTLHWHAHCVSALALTPDGRYLLSGGAEAVLVVWQLDRDGGHEKTFAPRLGAPVTAIATGLDGGAEREEAGAGAGAPLIAVATADNTVRLLSLVDLECCWALRGVALDPFACNVQLHDPNALVRGATGDGGGDPGAAAVMQLVGLGQNMSRSVGHGKRSLVTLNAHAGSLQLYDPHADAMSGEVLVVPHNAVSRADVFSRPSTDGSASLESGSQVSGASFPFVLHSRFSAHDGGSILVTVDAWVVSPAAPSSSDVCVFAGPPTLRFWHTDGPCDSERGENGGFVLTTAVSKPHGEDASGAIAAVAYHPRMHVTVTAAIDGAFKTWARHAPAASSGDGSQRAADHRWQWDCLLTATANGGGSNCEIGGCTFSPDGSVMALVHCVKSGGTSVIETISLWDGNALAPVSGVAAVATVLSQLVPPRMAAPRAPLSTANGGAHAQCAMVAFAPCAPRSSVGGGALPEDPEHVFALQSDVVSSAAPAVSSGRWLVTAGGNMLSVWDLLDARVAWSYGWGADTLLDVAVAGEPALAIAVPASDEDEDAALPSADGGRSATWGTIAAAVRLKGERSGGAAGAVDRVAVLLFGIESAVPLCMWHLGDVGSAVSTLFVPAPPAPTAVESSSSSVGGARGALKPHSPSPSASRSGLLVLTRSCEMLLLRPHASAAIEPRGGHPRAWSIAPADPAASADASRVQRAPVLPVGGSAAAVAGAGAGAAKGASASKLDPPPLGTFGESVVSEGGARAGGLASVFDPLTINLPPPSELCAAVLGAHLRPPPRPPTEQAAPPSGKDDRNKGGAALDGAATASLPPVNVVNAVNAAGLDAGALLDVPSAKLLRADLLALLYEQS